MYLKGEAMRLDYYQNTLALRLVRLIEARRLRADVMSEWVQNMVELCIDATYQDCIEAGCGDYVKPFMLAYRKRQHR